MEKIEKTGIIFAIITSLVGVAVSLVSLLFSFDANRVARQQYELAAQQYNLERFGAEPVFKVDSYLGKDGFKYYMIQNTGTKIQDVTYTVKEVYPGSFFTREDGADVILETEYIVNVINRGMNHDKEFDEQAQSFSISAYRRFTENPVEPYNIKSAIRLAGGIPARICWIEVKINYKDYRGVRCSKTLIIEFRDLAADNRSWNEYSDYVVNRENENTSEENVGRLTIFLYDHQAPDRELREAFAAYCSERSLTLIDATR